MALPLLVVAMFRLLGLNVKEVKLSLRLTEIVAVHPLTSPKYA
jgi:hypothetical protein